MMFNFFKKPKEKKESATGGLMSLYKVGQPVWSGRDYRSFADEGYIKNVIAHRCVKIVATGISGIEWQLFSKRNDQLIKIEKHELLALLQRPNLKMASSDFLEAIISYRLISGNSYIEAGYDGNAAEIKKTPPKSLYVLRPDRIRIIAGAKGTPAGYKYEVAMGSSVTYPVSITGQSNIMHWQSFNPIDDWYGLAEIESGAFSIDQHNETSIWNQALLQNAATPSGAIFSKTPLSDEEFERVKSQIDQNYSGAKNAGRPMLFEGELDWKELSLSPKEMEFIEGKNSVARDIALAFGVPPQMLGIPGDNTYANMQEARLALWEQTILPLLDSLIAHLNMWLTPRFGEGLVLSYDMDKIPALNTRREAMRAGLEAAQFLTINEKRQAMGMDAVEGGDTILIDSNKVPLNFDAEEDNASDVVKSLRLLGYNSEEIKGILRNEFNYK